MSQGERGARGPRGRPAILGFAILLVFCGIAAWQLERQTSATARLAEQVVISNRAGCERLNVVRFNQARVLSDQVRMTKITLAHPLNGLTKFRSQIVEGQRSRRRALRRLRRSVKDFPVPGHPYEIDCEAAFP